MPTIDQFTAPVAQGFAQGPSASAASFGGDQTGAMAQARAMQNTGQAFDEMAQKISVIEERRQNRIDTINLARTTDAFYNDAFNEFNRAMSEDDIVDPASTEKFNAFVRDMAAKKITEFQGSPDAKARLEAQIMNQASEFTRQMTQNSIGAQRKFIMMKAGDKIDALANMVTQDPSQIGNVMKQAADVIAEFSPALYPEDEIALTKAAREQVSMTVIETYLDRGMYDEVNQLIDTNPAVLENIQPDAQRRVLSEINKGIQDRNKVFEEAKKKKDLLDWGQEITGQKVDPMASLNFIMGSNIKKSDEQILSEVANIYGMKPEDLPPEVILKVKYPDLKLFDAETDQTKDRGEGGKLTAQGISKNLAPIISSVEDIRNRKLMLDTAIEQGKSGNLAATQAAVIAFRKMLDPTSAVMQSEFETQKSAADISDRIDLMFSPGKTITSDQLDELKQFTDQFTQELVKSKKKKADFLIIDADNRLMRRIDIGIPKEVYKDIFGTDVIGEQTQTPTETGLEKMTDEDLQKMLDEMEKAGK